MAEISPKTQPAQGETADFSNAFERVKSLLAGVNTQLTEAVVPDRVLAKARRQINYEAASMLSGYLSEHPEVEEAVAEGMNAGTLPRIAHRSAKTKVDIFVLPSDAEIDEQSLREGDGLSLEVFPSSGSGAYLAMGPTVEPADFFVYFPGAQHFSFDSHQPSQATAAQAVAALEAELYRASVTSDVQ